jgi:hypothetical protein
MTKDKPETRTAATKPAATRHLNENQKEALDLPAEVEHSDGPQREKLTRKIEQLGSATPRQ